MSIKFWNILLVLALFLTLAGGGYILYQNHQSQLAEVEVARVAAEQERAREAEARAVKKKFEAGLSGFLQTLKSQAQEYKGRRKVLSGLIDPANLRMPEYVEENYNLGESTTMALQLQMNSILGMFEQTGKDLTLLIERLPEEQAASAQEKWERVKADQMDLYVKFFESEQKIMTQTQELLAFYNAHKESMNVDVENNRIVFSNIENQAAAFEMTKALKELVDEQAEILK